MFLPHEEAAAEVQKAGIKVKPEVMIPLVEFKKELDLQVGVVHRVAKEVIAEKKVKIAYLVGTMIEVPRGALTADEIANTAVPPWRDHLWHERPHADLPGHGPRCPFMHCTDGSSSLTRCVDGIPLALA